MSTIHRASSKLPEYEPPYPYSPPEAEWRRGLTGEWTVSTAEIDVRLAYPDGQVSKVLTDPVGTRGLWTVAHWTRDLGMLGCWKERLMVGRREDKELYRLGALYVHGPFELTHRETAYHEFGEMPYDGLE